MPFMRSGQGAFGAQWPVSLLRGNLSFFQLSAPLFFQQCKQCLGKQFDQCCECFGKCFYYVVGNVKYFLILTVGSKKCLRETRIIFGRQIFSDCSGLSALTFRSVDDLEHTQCIVFSDRKRCVLVVGPQFIDKYFTERIKKKR